MRVVRLGFLCVLLLASCAPGPRAGATSGERNGVSYRLRVLVDQDGVGVLEGTFSPLATSWHLYSQELSMDGVDGIGRPTRLEVTSGANVSGPATADVDTYVLPVESLGIEVPVYPDGPVTLTTPIELTNGPLVANLTYMSCSSDGGCSLPVVGHEVQIELSGGS